jgi:sialate O-acetylesterase
LKVVCGVDSIQYKNILMGEVWLCSGQSNMEMPLAGWPPSDTIFTAANEIPIANYPNLRFFTVDRATAISPEEDCKGSWSLCSPSTASTFSATAFFFGKKLMTDLNVPIGLIHSSWGGSPIEAWMGAEPLSKFPEYAEYIKGMEKFKEESEKLKVWLANLPQIDMQGKSGTNIWENLDFGDAMMSNPDFDDSKWQTTEMPSDWANFGFGNFDGVIWFRTIINIPDSWLNKDLTISLGPIDDMDVTFVNGSRVGGYETGGHWQTERNYLIPAKLVNSKSLQIAVRVLDNMQGGGMYGRGESFRIHLKDTQESNSIAGKWKYLPVAEFRNSTFYLYSGNNFDFVSRPKITSEVTSNSPTTLFNAMISPIAPFKIRGAIWYQGESNTWNPDRYTELFPMMVENWRELWGDKFSFYFTQIAPYRYNKGTNSELLREAQFLSMSVPKSGMAVTLDIGNPLNIHPGNKKDVGERLALWALAKDYGKKIPYSGPVYRSHTVENGAVLISFEHSDGLILKPVAGKLNFQIAGDDKVFYEATAVVNGTNVVVSSPMVKNPVAVRYCWNDTAEATLFNGAGLPASSFRTDKWK